MSQFTFVTTAEPLLQYSAPSSKGPVYVQQGPVAGTEPSFAIAHNGNGAVPLGRMIQNHNNAQVLPATVASDQWGRAPAQRIQDAPRAVYSSQPVIVQQGVQYIKATPAVAASSAMSVAQPLKGVQYRHLANPTIISAPQQLVQVPQLPEGYYLIKSSAPGQQPPSYSVVQQAPRTSTVQAAAAAAMASTNVAAGRPQFNTTAGPATTLLPAEFVRMEPAQPGVQYVRAAAPPATIIRAAAPRPPAQIVTQLAPGGRQVQQLQHVQLQLQLQPQRLQQVQQQVQQIRVAMPTPTQMQQVQQQQMQQVQMQQVQVQQQQQMQQMQVQQVQQQQQMQQMQVQQHSQASSQPQQMQMKRVVTSAAPGLHARRNTQLVQLQQLATMPRPATSATTLKAQIAIDANGNHVVLPGDTLPAGYTLASAAEPAGQQAAAATSRLLQQLDTRAAVIPAIGAAAALKAMAEAAGGGGDNQSISFNPAAAPRLGVIGDGKRSSRPQSEGGSPRSVASSGVPSSADAAAAAVAAAVRGSSPPLPEPGARSPSSDAVVLQGAGAHGIGIMAPPPGVLRSDVPGGRSMGDADQHALLCNLGQRFAQLGLSVEQAISSGLVGGLSVQQFKVFAESHAHELQAVADAQQQQGSVGSGSSSPDAMLVLDGQQLEQGDGNGPPQPQQEGQFNAFSYGFFCDVPAAAAAPGGQLELLGALEDGGATALEAEPEPEGSAGNGAVAGGSWGSGATSQDGQAGNWQDVSGAYDAIDAKLEQLYLGASFF